MTKSAYKIGAVIYVLWGLLHIMAAYRIYDLGSGVADAAVAARIAQAGWNLGIIAIFSIVIAIRLNWRNDRLGYWLNLSVVSAADIGFIVLLLVPGHFPLVQGMLGPALWLLAVLFSTIGLRQANA